MPDKFSNHSPHHRLRNGIIIGIPILLVLGTYIAMRTDIQNYTPLGENSKVAEVCFTQPQPYEWSGIISFFDKEGNLSHPQKFHVIGERIQLHGDFVRLPSFLNILAVPNSYRLISAEGAYSVSKSKKVFTQTTQIFNSEDWLFTTAPNLPPFSWFVKPVSDNYNVPFNPAGTMKTTLYIIYATEQGLMLKATPQKLPNCNTLPV